jgi:hypothetical protein
MAVRPGEGGRLALSPRARLIAGWVAALAVIGIIALAVRILGGNADGAAVVPSPSQSAGAAEEIQFGTALNATSDAVPETARAERFLRGDTFAYAVAGVTDPPEVVYVEVERVTDGDPGIVQAAADGEQTLPEGRMRIAFSVPAANLLDAFGTGTFRMRIHADLDAAPIAEGTFELIEPPAATASP